MCTDGEQQETGQVLSAPATRAPSGIPAQRQLRQRIGNIVDGAGIAHTLSFRGQSLRGGFTTLVSEWQCAHRQQHPACSAAPALQTARPVTRWLHDVSCRVLSRLEKRESGHRTRKECRDVLMMASVRIPFHSPVSASTLASVLALVAGCRFLPRIVCASKKILACGSYVRRE